MLTAKMNKPFSLRMPDKMLPLIANGVMLIFLSYLFSQLGTHILKLMQPDTKTVYLVDTHNIPKQITVSSRNITRKIASMHLFGKIEKKAARAVKKQIVAPVTKLNLTLRGIVAEDQKHLGLAIIQEDKKKDEKPFSVKQSVFGLATLEEIYEDRVILLRNGNYETLRLPENALPREHFINRAEIQAARKRAATDYRNRFLYGDGEDIINFFGFDTAYKNGGFIGFVVKALGEEGLEMMAILGVEDGDLITVVNDMRLSESLEAVNKLKQLKTATSVDVIIERNGNEIPFHFEFDLPATTANNSGSVTAQPDNSPASHALLPDNSAGQIPGGTAVPRTHVENAANTPPASTPGATSRFIPDTGDGDDLGKDWGESNEDRQFIEQQQSRKTSSNQPVEFDH